GAVVEQGIVADDDGLPVGPAHDDLEGASGRSPQEGGDTLPVPVHPRSRRISHSRTTAAARAGRARLATAAPPASRRSTGSLGDENTGRGSAEVVRPGSAEPARAGSATAATAAAPPEAPPAAPAPAGVAAAPAPWPGSSPRPRPVRSRR